MAAKKKQSLTQRHKRQQKKQQRRAARVDKRQAMVQHREAAWPGLTSPGLSLLRDNNPLSNDPNKLKPSPQQIEQLLTIVWNSDDMAEEPELTGIAIAPLDALNAYIEAAEELGYGGSEELYELDDEQQEEAFQDILSAVAKRLLSDDLLAEIVAGLERLHQRWRTEKRQQDMHRLEVIQLILNAGNLDEIAGTVGLVRSLFLRSVSAGLMLMDAAGGPVDLTDASPKEVYNRLQNTGEQSLSLLEMPGMRQFMEKQLDGLWEDGLSAIYEGELRLRIYTDEEISAAGEIFRLTQADQPLDNAADADAFMQTLVPKLEQFLEQTLTPERIQQLRSRLAEIINEPAYGDTRFVPFLMMLHDDMEDADTIDDMNWRFLMMTLAGEVRTMGDIGEDEPAQS